MVSFNSSMPHSDVKFPSCDVATINASHVLSPVSWGVYSRVVKIGGGKRVDGGAGEKRNRKRRVGWTGPHVSSCNVATTNSSHALSPVSWCVYLRVVRTWEERGVD